MDISEYTKMLLEREALPKGITRDFKDIELEKALSEHRI
jgi:hypothetical protein